MTRFELLNTALTVNMYKCLSVCVENLLNCIFLYNACLPYLFGSLPMWLTKVGIHSMARRLCRRGEKLIARGRVAQKSNQRSIKWIMSY